VTAPEKRPEPVMDAAGLAGAIAGAIVAVGGLLRAVRLLPVEIDVQVVADEASRVVFALAALWAFGGPLLVARLRARDKVTPLVDPRAADGRPLVVEGEVAGPVQTARPLPPAAGRPVDIAALQAEYFGDQRAGR
jgi:hypothetical protein